MNKSVTWSPEVTNHFDSCLRELIFNTHKLSFEITFFKGRVCIIHIDHIPHLNKSGHFKFPLIHNQICTLR